MYLTYGMRSYIPSSCNVVSRGSRFCSNIQRPGMPANALARPRKTSYVSRHAQQTRRKTVVVRAKLEEAGIFSNLMNPEVATIFSAVIAVSSVLVNLYGGVITERKRAELQKEVRNALWTGYSMHGQGRSYMAHGVSMVPSWIVHMSCHTIAGTIDGLMQICM